MLKLSNPVSTSIVFHALCFTHHFKVKNAQPKCFKHHAFNGRELFFRQAHGKTPSGRRPEGSCWRNARPKRWFTWDDDNYPLGYESRTPNWWPVVTGRGCSTPNSQLIQLGNVCILQNEPRAMRRWSLKTSPRAQKETDLPPTNLVGSHGIAFRSVSSMYNTYRL